MKNNENNKPKPGAMMGRGGPINNSVEKAKDFKGTIKRLLGFLKEYKLGVLIVILFSIASSIFAIRGPKILGTAITEISEGLISKLTGGSGINFDKILSILLILILLYIFSSVFSFLQGYIMSGISQKVAFRLRSQISNKIHKIPLKYFESRTTGEILSCITNDVDTVSQNLSQSMTQVISSVVTLIGVIIMMLTISPLMTIVSLLVLPIGFVMMFIVIKKSQKYFIIQQEYLSIINGAVEENYGGHNIVKTYNGEEKAIEEFEKTNEIMYTSAWKSQFLSGMMHPIMSFIGNIGYVTVSILGGYLTIKNKIKVGDILSFSQYIRNFNQPIAQLSQIANLLQSTAAASERVFAFLDEKEEVQTVENSISIEKIEGNIEFKNVEFGYNKDKIVINNFSTKVRKGEKIAIVGPTGAGKTTIVKLLMHFYDINNGTIKIDGHDIKDFNRDELRSLFGMVLQDAWLFNGTIKDNIKYGRLDATLEEIVNAADNAYVDHFIRTLPDEYNMVLDEESSNISGGQKQLLTIARVILRDPKILILDEATSSVDTRTEVLIQKAMDKLMKGRTSFIIAHRLSTIRNADTILVMKDGDIVEQGSHEELLSKNGFYTTLYNSQFEEDK